MMTMSWCKELRTVGQHVREGIDAVHDNETCAVSQLASA
jgi:hypothetical protein